MSIKTGKELADACKKVATQYKTLYVAGCFGAPMNDKNKTRYYNHHEYNRQAARWAKIKVASADTFGFDCVCLVKGLLWGWSGDTSKTYGGAAYASNGVPDITANSMIKQCTGVSTDFKNLCIGEYLWMDGHCGIYIGNGLAVECTPVWKDGVQITAVGNIGSKSGYNTRTWEKHGKLPYVSYEAPEKSESGVTLATLKQGDKGDAVKTMQALLALHGAFVDGDFDADTDKAVRAFQKKNGLTVDGCCGPKTWAKLLSL